MAAVIATPNNTPHGALGTRQNNTQFVPEQNAVTVSKDSEISKMTDDTSTQNLDNTEAESRGKMRAFPDGSRLEWDWSKEGVQPYEHPLFNVAADAMQITRSEAYQQQDIVANIAKWALELTQTEDPAELYNFISQHLRRAPMGGNRLYGFARYMEILHNKGGEEE